MGIANVIEKLGFTTSETEPLATEVYADAGQANLTFTMGYIQGAVKKYRDNGLKLSEAEIKRLVTFATLASNMAANAAALAEVGIPADALADVVNDVMQWIANKQKALKESKTPPPENMN